MQGKIVGVQVQKQCTLMYNAGPNNYSDEEHLPYLSNIWYIKVKCKAIPVTGHGRL
jgi:hypothetical protein